MGDDGKISGASELTVGDLEAFAGPWDRHEVDAIMTFFTDDGVKLEMIGCDPVAFENGKIAVKNAFRKERIS